MADTDYRPIIGAPLIEITLPVAGYPPHATAVNRCHIITTASFEDRTFAAAGPHPWNSLPVQLRNPDTTYGHTFFEKHEHGAP